MRTAKLRRRRSIYSDLVKRAWLTLETSAELIEERRAQIKKLGKAPPTLLRAGVSETVFWGKTRGVKPAAGRRCHARWLANPVAPLKRPILVKRCRPLSVLSLPLNRFRNV